MTRPDTIAQAALRDAMMFDARVQDVRDQRHHNGVALPNSLSPHQDQRPLSASVLEKIRYLRKHHWDYKSIANRLRLSERTISNACKHNRIA